jgi:hypothetical protein
MFELKGVPQGFLVINSEWEKEFRVSDCLEYYLLMQNVFLKLIYRKFKIRLIFENVTNIYSQFLLSNEQ